MNKHRVTVLNVLPVTLAHYERALTHQMMCAGEPSPRVRHADIERVSGRSRFARLMSFLRVAFAVRGEPGVVVVVWPALGAVEPLLWRLLRRGRTTVLIVHDPSSLRRRSHAPRSARRLISRLGRSGELRIVVHSGEAAEEMRRDGWAVEPVIAHPVLPAGDDGRGAVSEQRVLVLGQFKIARDLELLSALGEDLVARGWSLEIQGAGWPVVPGWVVQDRRLSEAEFDQAIDQCSCVLLPYNRYYQSGVAVRCLERTTPVVGTECGFLSELLGLDWPGLVPPGGGTSDWIEAIHRVQSIPPERLVELRTSAHQRGVAGWRDLIARC